MEHPRPSEDGRLVRYKECIDNGSVTIQHWVKVTGIRSHSTSSIHFGHGSKMPAHLCWENVRTAVQCLTELYPVQCSVSNRGHDAPGSSSTAWRGEPSSGSGPRLLVHRLLLGGVTYNIQINEVSKVLDMYLFFKKKKYFQGMEKLLSAIGT